METTKKYYVYGITYYDTKGKKLCVDFYLNKEERDLIFEQGESKVYPTIFPAEEKAIFRTWRVPVKYTDKRKKLYLVEEPTCHIGTTAEDYKIKEIIETETQTNIFDEIP